VILLRTLPSKLFLVSASFRMPFFGVLLLTCVSSALHAESELRPVGEVTLVLGMSVLHPHDGSEADRSSEATQSTLGTALRLSRTAMSTSDLVTMPWLAFGRTAGSRFTDMTTIHLGRLRRW